MLQIRTVARRAPNFFVAVLVSLLWSCGGGSSDSGAPPPGALTITTSALPNGQVGKAYSAMLAASGGTAPMTWTLTSGTLPAGLALNAQTGAITGTPTATVAAAALTFAVTDSSSPAKSDSAPLHLNVSPSTITVSASPARTGLAVTQILHLTATTNDNAGVAWSVGAGGGTFSPASSASGTPVTFTAGTTAGTYTITATSLTDGSVSATISVGVTDLAGVYTFHNDLARDGVYAQPLWVANLSIGAARHNVIFIATAHDSLYAFDADASPCVQLWHANLIDTTHGANAGEVTVPGGVTGFAVGQGFADIAPEVGVIGTPVIDPASGTLFVVSKSMDAGAANFYQRLHAIDVTTGNEKAGSPVNITASYPTAAGGSVAFSTRQENQRTGLALVNGV